MTEHQSFITNNKHKFIDKPNGVINKVEEGDKAFHEWYRFVLSYPPHLVRDYISKFNLSTDQTILDPFCGTGTTVLEAKLNGISGIGIEANHFAHFASEVKINWDINTNEMIASAVEIKDRMKKELAHQGIDDDVPFLEDLDKWEKLEFPPKQQSLFIKNSISPVPLHKSILLLRYIETLSKKPFYPHLKLALSKTLVFSISNLRFGPEVGVGKIKKDSPVIEPWFNEVTKIAEDIDSLEYQSSTNSRIFLGDSRNISELKKKSIDAIITSPPYPNEKDYSRTTRLETVFLGFIKNAKELQAMKKTFVRSNTRGVYVSDKDDTYIAKNKDIQKLANQIEARRIELGKTSGFEKRYAWVTKQYFGGMARHLEEIKPYLKKGARLAYVVGDQASYLRVMIRTGQLLASIAENQGYSVEGIDLFRTRFATATQEELREEVVLLKWE